MLQLKPNCECCDEDLPPASENARICSFECTFCSACAESEFSGRCPNCTGELVKRPVRPVDRLPKIPASIERFINPKHANRASYKTRGTQP